MKAIGYIRVSTDGQAAEGVSLDAQRERIAAWCIGNGFDLEHVFVDAGISGGRSDNRPGLAAALDAACKSKGALVVYSLSRLARSTKDMIAISERLDKAGADLVSLSERLDTTSAAGKMVFRMLAVLSEFERDQVSERTRAAMQFIRKQGRRAGRVPFGYDLASDGHTLTANAHEQEAIALMKVLREEGHSLREIVSALETQGIRPKTGQAWHASSVRAILEAA